MRTGLLLAHPASQGALVTILWLCALSAEPPQRAVMMLALPPVRAVLPSVALTVLKLPMSTCAELLLVARNGVEGAVVRSSGAAVSSDGGVSDAGVARARIAVVVGDGGVQ